ncbi:MAG: DUF1490 family protein [Methanosphaera stadtmanae]|nr:DUF1490 family protein [Methanosphaera stadtmanae]
MAGYNDNDNGLGLTNKAVKFFGQTKVKYFIGGMVAAYAIKKIAETDAAHNAAVSLTAGALELKDSIEEGIENIKEDAEDIHEEAKEKQQIEIFGPDDIEDKDEEKTE